MDATTYKSLRVLVVDDEEVDYLAVQRMLLKGWPQEVAVTWIEDPAVVLNRLQTETFDVVFMDNCMGSAQGVEVIQELRDCGIDTPVIMMTGFDNPEVEDGALTAGADDFLVKGQFDIAMLRRVLRYALARHGAEQEMRLLKSAFDRGVDGHAVAVASSDGRGPVLAYANAAFQEITGRSEHDLLDLPVAQLFEVETRSELLTELQLAFDKGSHFVADTPLRRGESGRFLANVEISSITTTDARPRYSILLRDVTAQRASENRIREQARMLNLAREAIVATDCAGKVRYWNQGATQLLGIGEADVSGRFIQDVMDLRAETYEEACRAALNAGAWSGEFSFSRRDGMQLNLESHWTLLQDENDEAQGILMINADVTEQRQLREKFFRAQRMESIGSLAAGVAHDLNNILSPIIMGASMMDPAIMEPDELTSLRETIEKSADRGARIVKQLLTFARGAESERVTVQMRHLVSEIGDLTRETFPPGIKIKLETPRDLWPVKGNPTELHQVILNLMVNARDAMGNEGVLSVVGRNQVIDNLDPNGGPTCRPGNYTTFAVTDTGTGIPEEIRDKIYESFFTTKPKGVGTGLGLATVKTIVDSHGGFIDLKSRWGEGTCFTVGFPAQPSGEEHAERSGLATVSGHGETILLVDDEPSIRIVMSKTLEAHGYHVLSAGNGEEGSAIFVKNQDLIDVVLTDVLMPVMDGPTMVREILSRNPEQKVLFMSGASRPPGESEGPLLKEQFPDIECLDKPFTAQQLLHQVQAVVSAGPPARVLAVP